MTTANKITIIRILLVPLFIVEVLNYVGQGNELHRYLAIAAFLVASVCDGVDGYIARRYNQRSELGAILDPLADKLLVVAGIVLLSLHHESYLPHLPLWLTATVISRDVLLLLGLVVIHYICGKVIVKPHVIGKVATVFQMVAVCWALLAPLVGGGGGGVHGSFRCDLRVRWRAAVERQSGQLADTQTVSGTELRCV